MINWIKRIFKKYEIKDATEISDRFQIFQDHGFDIECNPITNIGNIQLKQDGVAIILRFPFKENWMRSEEEKFLCSSLETTLKWIKKSDWTYSQSSLKEYTTIVDNQETPRYRTRGYRGYGFADYYPIYIFYRKGDEKVLSCFDSYYESEKTIDSETKHKYYHINYGRVGRMQKNPNTFY